jgi:S1-C subfamily serine protease
MKALAAALFLFLPALAEAQDWALAAARVAQASVYLESPESGCTGFVIDSERDYILTAAHCLHDDLYADSLPVEVVFKDLRRDLMVLYVEGIGEGREALRLAAVNPKLGEEVASHGFGYSLELPMFRIAHVSMEEARVDGAGPFIAIDAAFVAGQSGGAVVNPLGEVVMIVQRASNLMGVGVGAETIRGRVKKFFAKAP